MPVAPARPGDLAMPEHRRDLHAFRNALNLFPGWGTLPVKTLGEVKT
jgi:hypothetical protein